MKNEEAIAVLRESKRQNEVMRDNPTQFWNPDIMAEAVANTEKRIEALDLAIAALASQYTRLDREAWKPCECCKDANEIHGWAMSVQKSKDGMRCMTNFEGAFKHCPECGRPLTPEAWAELEKRLRE